MKLRLAPVDEDDEIDLTPMIDCIFQLVLFFMVTASFIEEPSAGDKKTFTISLAKAERPTGSSGEEGESVHLVVSGQYLFVDPAGKQKIGSIQELLDPRQRAALPPIINIRCQARIEEIRETKMEEAHGYKITLPRAENPATIPRADADTLTVTADGRYFFSKGGAKGGEKVENLEELLHTLKKRKGEEQKRPVILRCDARCEYRQFVQVRNVLKLAAVDTIFEEVELAHDKK